MISRQTDYAMLHPYESGSDNRTVLAMHPVPILVVEDSKVTAITVSRILIKAGYFVRMVADGKEAVAAHAKNLFAVILMDYEMPEMNGAEATAAIRAAERVTGIHTPIVGYSASAGSDQCLAAGMDDFLLKPASPALLTARIMLWSAAWRHAHETFV